MLAPNVRAKGTKGSAPATGTQTSPRITRNPYASGSASGLGPAPVTSGGIYAKARGVGSYADEYVPPHPARSLSFTTPQVGQGSQSLKKNPSTTISGEKRNPAVAKSSQQKNKVKIGDDEEEEANIQDGTYDQDIDFVPITDKATDKTGKRMSGSDDNIGDDIVEGMRLAHRKALMEKAFPEVPNLVHHNAQVQSASMKSCRPKSEVDYIIHVLTHWEKGTVVKKMDPGQD